jgi:ribosomal protein S18 acetylase RimI-like enzyme
LNIRECSQQDLDIVTNYTLSLHQHENEKGIQAHPNLKTNIRKWLQSEIDSTNSLILIAETDGNPIGFVCATTTINDNGFIAQPLKGIIQLLWVEEPNRQKKVAEKLIATIELCLQEAGVSYVECTYVDGNLSAKHFWRNQGYQVTSLTCRKFLT